MNKVKIKYAVPKKFFDLTPQEVGEIEVDALLINKYVSVHYGIRVKYDGSVMQDKTVCSVTGHGKKGGYFTFKYNKRNIKLFAELMPKLERYFMLSSKITEELYKNNRNLYNIVQKHRHKFTRDYLLISTDDHINRNIILTKLKTALKDVKVKRVRLF